jgi:hypothetical protein
LPKIETKLRETLEKENSSGIIFIMGFILTLRCNADPITALADHVESYGFRPPL